MPSPMIFASLKVWLHALLEDSGVAKGMGIRMGEHFVKILLLTFSGFQNLLNLLTRL